MTAHATAASDMHARRPPGPAQPREPRLDLWRLHGRLPADVVLRAATHGEGDRAHRPGDDSAGLKHVFRHVSRRRLAIGPGDAGHLEPPRRPAVELGRQLREADTSGGHAKYGNPWR